MATSWDDDLAESSASAGGSEQASSLESLACVTCRARKLKCELMIPVPSTSPSPCSRANSCPGLRALPYLGLLSSCSTPRQLAYNVTGDRRGPICTRCEKSGNTCVYPETRRKPAFKRRNVKELEQRLGKDCPLLFTCPFLVSLGCYHAHFSIRC